MAARSERRHVGRYELLERLSESEVSTRFLARTSDLAERLVVDIVHPQYALQSAFSTVLLAEAPAAVAFRHPFALRVREVDQGVGTALIASAEPQGFSLRAVLEAAEHKGVTLPLSFVLHVAVALADLLRALEHTPWRAGATAGMRHGSLAPESVFIDRFGQLRVADVGLARARLALPAPLYVLANRAPEMFEGSEGFSAAADVYSLGSVLYDLLFGRSVFIRDDPDEVRMAVTRGSRPRLARVRADVDPNLEAAVEWMLAAHPSERPQTVASVVGMLQDGRLRLEESARPVAPVETWLGQLFPNGRAGPSESARLEARGSASLAFQNDAAQSLLRAPSQVDLEPPPPEVDALTPGPLLDPLVEEEDAIPLGDWARNGHPPILGPMSPLEGQTLSVPVAPRTSSPETVIDFVAVASESEETLPVLAPAPTPVSFDVEEVSADLLLPPATRTGRVEPHEPSEPKISDLLVDEQSVEDRYVRRGPLGSGDWQLGEDRRSGRAVLIEQVPPPLDPEALEQRLVDLARLGDHPHVLQLVEARHDPSAGTAEAVSWHQAGEPLSDRVARDGPLELVEVSRLLAQMTEGLAHLHRAEIVHGALHPESIVVRERGPRLDSAVGGLLHMVGGLDVADPAFLSPEQAAGKPAHPASDVFALGSVLFFALVGEGPYAVSSRASFADRILQAPAPCVSERRPGAHRFDRILRCILVADPGARPQSANALLQALRAPRHER